MKLVDRTGERYGMLTVIERGGYYVSPAGRKVVKWVCRCDCGNIIEVTGVHLHSGNSLSCGCYGRQQRLKAVKKGTHNKSRTRIYHIWQLMKYRCLNPAAANYSTYGGRGITVCDDWKSRNGFESFYEWSVNNGYDDSLSLDRIDVNGNYEPENCRWVDEETQHNNTQSSVKITYNGKTMTAAQWAREIGVDRHTIYDRLRKGLPIEEVLGPRKKQKHTKAGC